MSLFVREGIELQRKFAKVDLLCCAFQAAEHVALTCHAKNAKNCSTADPYRVLPIARVKFPPELKSTVLFASENREPQTHFCDATIFSRSWFQCSMCGRLGVESQKERVLASLS